MVQVLHPWEDQTEVNGSLNPGHIHTCRSLVKKATGFELDAV